MSLDLFVVENCSLRRRRLTYYTGLIAEDGDLSAFRTRN